MAVEIERKFLVHESRLPELVHGNRMSQGYFPMLGPGVVRVRIAGQGAWLTIKGETQGIRRAEFEYPIPVADAESLLETFCGAARIEKTRYNIEHDGRVWELDIFAGANQGLLVAEIELPDVHTQPALPDWVGNEVSGDARYYNSNLIKAPYTSWPAS